jgi:5-deoxy-glucuronate isomerase
MLKKTYTEKPGFTLLAQAGETSLQRMEFGMLALEQGMRHLFPALPDKETAFVILSGRCAVRAGDSAWPCVGKRRNVFGGPAAAFFAFPGTEVEITALERLSVAVTFAPSSKQGQPVLVNPGDVVVKSLGRLNWARDAHFIIDERIDAQHLYIGESFLQGWSSYPPHRHDVDDMPDENQMEELYFFKFNLPQGYGAQFVYTDDGSLDEVYRVKNNDLVEIPRGYHPFVTAPGYTGYMLWIMSGGIRGFYMRSEPDHAWVNAMDGFIGKTFK